MPQQRVVVTYEKASESQNDQHKTWIPPEGRPPVESGTREADQAGTRPDSRLQDHQRGTGGRAGLSRSKRGSPVTRRPLVKFDRLDPQLLRQLRLVLPNLADHRLGCLPLEEELTTFWVRALTTP
jgi:hypothetical protein